jgi:hypothetical protein
MEDASPATFRPTWQQALGRGLYLGALIGVVGITTALAFGRPVLAFGPAIVGAVIGLLLRRFTGVELGARGIRTRSGFAPWHRVVDMRAERRGKRTVVSVYLDSGASVQLQAPYSGDLFAADPRFESKMFALSHLWRSHRFGGLPG